MGGFCTPTYTPLPSSGETVEGTEIPSWVAAAGRTLFERSAQLAEGDYPLYTGARTQTYTGGSNLTDAERQGMGILTSGAENYMPYMNRASGIAGTLGRGYDAMSSSELMGDPYSGASRGYLEGNFKGLSSDELLGNYQGATREDLLGNYQGATREELLGNYQGATREELLGDPFNLSSAQPYTDIYQSSMDPAVREIEKQTLQAQNQARATAARGGGGFGSRLGIMEATTAGEGSRAAGDLRAQAAKEGLGFAAGRFDTDRAARAATENTMRNRFTQDQQSRFGAEDVMRGQFMEDRQGRFGAEDVMRGQFMEDRQGRMSVEDTRRAQAESDRAARFGAEDVMYGRYGDQRAARFGAQEAMRTGFETDEASRIAQMNAYQNMAPLISDLQNQAAAGLISVGEAQRQLDQRALDLAYADYLDQKEYPYEQLNFAMGALSGTPYNKVNHAYNMSTTMAANPSVYGQTIAGLGTLGSAYGTYKNSNR
jgi:hypothetical protein